MDELTITIRSEREDDFFGVDLEVYTDGDGNDIDIQSKLEFDTQFRDLLQALGARFVEILDQNAEQSDD